MSDPFTRNTPTTYEPVRIGFYLRDGGIVVQAELNLRNANGQIIDHDHPDTTLTAGERAAFLAWVLAELGRYEATTGLTRYAE